MWVVKIGGSLSADPVLPQWLELCASLGGGRITLVFGGGTFREHVQRAQAHWGFDDLAAHNMAVLAMAQTAYLAKGLQPALQIAATKAEIRRVLHGGQAAVWLPYEWTRSAPSPNASWEVTSDSIAVDLARKLNAERLVIVKSCEIDPAASLAQLRDAGVLDARFCAMSTGVGFPIDVIHKGELDRMRAMLLGETRPLPC